MASQRLVSGLPRVFPSLPPSPAPPCTCVEGWLCAAPHSSSLRPATAPFETPHLDSEVTSTLIRWLHATEGTRGRLVSCLYSDRGGEFLSGILAGFCREQGILQSRTLPESPQQNGVAERRIGLVLEIARTSMIHTRAPHFLWPYVVRYAAHQLNLWSRVSRPEASSTSLWTGSSGVASQFCVWGSLVLVCNTFADKLSPRALPCVFLSFPEGSSNYTFYHPPLHRFLDSRDVTFDESISYYTRYPCRGPPVPPPPLFFAPDPPLAPAPPVHPPPPWFGLVWCVAHHPPPLDSAPGADPRGASSGGAGAEGAATDGTDSGGVGIEGVVPASATSGGAGVAGTGGGHVRAGGVRYGVTGAKEGGAGANTSTREEQERLVQQRLGLEQQQQEMQRLEREQERQALQQEQQQQQQMLLQPPSLQDLLPPLSGLRALGILPPPPHHSSSPPIDITDLHIVPFRSSPPRPPQSVLPSPPGSSLTASSSAPITDYYRTYRPVLSRVLASLVMDPRAPLPSVSALTAAVTDFATTRRLDYATRVVAAPPTRPLSVRSESALGCDGDPDALDIPTPRSYAEVVSGPWASKWRGAMDAEMASYRSTCTYVDEVPPPRANVVDDMWIFKVKRPPGSPPVFKARYVARGFSQHNGVDFFQTFAPTPKMTTLRVLLHVVAQRDYELHSLNLHKEIWMRRPPGFTSIFTPGTRWSLRRPVYGLRQAHREWHDTLCLTLSDLGFAQSTIDPSLFVRRGPTPFFVLVYVNDLILVTADRVALAKVKSELQKRYTCIDLGELRHYLGLQITRDRAARTITLTQSRIVQQVLQRFGLQHSTAHPTPLAVDHRLTDPFPNKPFEPSGPYIELVGCLIYLITCSRPELAFPLSVLALFVATGRNHLVHWRAAVWMAKYMATTSGMGHVLGGTQPVVLIGHYDSCYTDDVETHRSTQG
ncbi:unnamed protein product [Closterium sp. NIES-53]